jgi:hypothetical protein
MPGLVARRNETMDVNQGTPTGNEPVGDAAPQNGTPVVDPTQGAPVVPTQAAAPAAPAPAPAAPAETDAERGLRQAADAERKKRQDLEGQLAQSQMMFAQLASRVQQPQATQPQAPEDPLGLSDADLLDPVKVRQGLLKVRQDAITATQQAVAEVQFRMQYPDFDQLVGAYDPATAHLPAQYQRFVPSEIMQDALKEDPTLSTQIQQAGNPRLFVYAVAKRQKQIRELRQAATTNTAQAAQVQQQAAARSAANTVAALTAPMSPSGVAGAPAQTAATGTDLETFMKNPGLLDQIVRGIESGKYG